MNGLSVPQFEEVLEQGKQMASNVVKTAVSDTTNSISGQIGIQNEVGQAGQNSQISQAEPSSSVVNSEATTEMIEDFYAPSVEAGSLSPQGQEEATTQQNLQKVRQELKQHQELHTEVYVEPLFAYQNKEDEHPAEEAEKIEEQKKMAELEQREQEKKLPIAAQNAAMNIEARGQNPG